MVDSRGQSESDRTTEAKISLTLDALRSFIKK